MTCPHCQKEISQAEVSSQLGKIKSDKKSKQSAVNGKAPVKPGSNPRGRPTKPSASIQPPPAPGPTE